MHASRGTRLCHRSPTNGVCRLRTPNPGFFSTYPVHSRTTNCHRCQRIPPDKTNNLWAADRSSREESPIFATMRRAVSSFQMHNRRGAKARRTTKKSIGRTYISGEAGSHMGGSRPRFTGEQHGSCYQVTDLPHIRKGSRSHLPLRNKITSLYHRKILGKHR